MYNQCIFYNIKNFWLKLTHCENKSWKKLCPSFLNCKIIKNFASFFHKILGRIFFPQLVGAGIFFYSELPCRNFFFSKSPTSSPSKVKWSTPYKLFQFKADLAAILEPYCCHGNVTYKFILTRIRLLTCSLIQINLFNFYKE